MLARQAGSGRDLATANSIAVAGRGITSTAVAPLSLVHWIEWPGSRFNSARRSSML